VALGVLGLKLSKLSDAVVQDSLGWRFMSVH
jgi:hypothetical protein